MPLQISASRPPLVETDDAILIDIPDRTIRLDVSDAVIADRRAALRAKGGAAWKPLDRKRHVSPALRAYAALTTNAARGAIRDVT